MRDLIRRIPAVVRLLEDIPGFDCELERWDLESAASHPISPGLSRCIQSEWEWSVDAVGEDPGRSDRLRGVVERHTSIGYGTVSTDEVQKVLVFEEGDHPISEGQEVSFRIEREGGRTRAVDVRPHERTVLADEDDRTKYRVD